MLIVGALDMIILVLGDGAVVELAVDGLGDGTIEDEAGGTVGNDEDSVDPAKLPTKIQGEITVNRDILSDR